MEKRQHSYTKRLIPHLHSLRRVPEPCRQMLPLAMVRRYQCVVIGNVGGMLTVAITNRRDMPVVELLGRLTGYTIFPVLVDPARMRLLIRRLERSEHQEKHALLNYAIARPFVHPSCLPQVRSMVMLLSSLYGYGKRPRKPPSC